MTARHDKRKDSLPLTKNRGDAGSGASDEDRRPTPEPVTPPPDDEESSLLLDDFHLSGEEEPAAPASNDEPAKEPAMFDFENLAGEAPRSPADFSSRVWEDPVVLEDSDLASLLLIDEDSNALKPPAAGDAPKAAIGPPPVPSAGEEEDALSDLLLTETDDAPAATGEPVAQEPPPAEDFDLRIVPLDDEEPPGAVEKEGPERPASEEDSAFSLFLPEGAAAPAASEGKPGDDSPPDSVSEGQTDSIHDVDTVDLSDEPTHVPPHIEEATASDLLLGEDESDTAAGAADLESAAGPPDAAAKTADDRSALLADLSTLPGAGTDAVNGISSPLPDTEADPGESVAEGQSSLLMNSGYEASAAPRTEEPVRGKRKGRRAKRERMKIVVPKPDKKIEWFSNPSACSTYCRKHKRPLMIYFSTGDPGQCQTYEDTVRREEVQPFLVPYVCCMADLRKEEIRQIAERLRLPVDGPSMIALSPTGREFARIVKPVIDWQFVATMLFWALR